MVLVIEQATLYTLQIHFFCVSRSVTHILLTFASFSLELGSSNCLMDNSSREKELCARCTIIQFNFVRMVDEWYDVRASNQSLSNDVFFLCNQGMAILWDERKNLEKSQWGFIMENKMQWLTVSTHAYSYAFLKSAILTAISIDTLDHTLLVFRARPVLNLLLDWASEEALKVFFWGKSLDICLHFCGYAVEKEKKKKIIQKRKSTKRFCKNFTFHFLFAFWAVKINKRKRVPSIS